MAAYPAVLEAEGGRSRQISEPKASLLYRVSFRTASTTQRDPISKTKHNKNNGKWAK